MRGRESELAKSHQRVELTPGNTVILFSYILFREWELHVAPGYSLIRSLSFILVSLTIIFFARTLFSIWNLTEKENKRETERERERGRENI